MLIKPNIITIAILSISIFDFSFYIKADKIFKEAQVVVTQAEQDFFKSKINYFNEKVNLLDEIKHTKNIDPNNFSKPTLPNNQEDLDITYIVDVLKDKKSTVSDYSYAASILSNLLYSNKFLSLQKQFDEKNLFDIPESKLTKDEKRYKEILAINAELEKKFNESLNNFQNGNIKTLIDEYKLTKGFLASLKDDEFRKVHKKYNDLIDKYKLQLFLINPDYFDEIALFFEKNSVLNKEDYYKIIKNKK